MLPTTPRPEPQQTGEHRCTRVDPAATGTAAVGSPDAGDSGATPAIGAKVEHRTQRSDWPTSRATYKAHLAALARYGSLGIGHRYAVAGLTALLRLGERVIWRASKCGVCRGRGWVPYLYALQACGVCAGTGYTIGG